MGKVFWLTGLPGSGKTTIVRKVELNFLEEGADQVIVLDGDKLRKSISSDLGFSKEDRTAHNQRIIRLCEFLVGEGFIVLVALVSPIRSVRDQARETLGENFAEIWVDCPIQECIKRDPKGMYKKAITGEIPMFTGISAPYEEPLNPELVIRTNEESVEQSAQKIIDLIYKM